MRLFNLL